MAVKVAQGIALLVGPIELDLFATANDGPNVSVNVKDRTTLNANGWRVKGPGLKEFSWSSKGFTDYDPTTVDDTLLLSNLAAVNPIAVMPDGEADGSLAYVANTLMLGFKIMPGPVGEDHTYELRGVGRNAGIARGLVLHPRASVRTTSGTGVARQLGALSASQTMWAAFNVLAVAGGSPSLTVKLQSAPTSGFASPTDRATFTVAGGRIADFRSVAGAVTDTWWRAAWTISGSGPQFRFGVAAGIG